MNCSKTFIGIYKKQRWLPSKEYLRDHRHEGIYTACTSKIFVGITQQFMGISIMYGYKCVHNIKLFVQIRKKEICLPNKEYMSGLGWEGINFVVKCIVYIRITAELKAYWLSSYLL